MKLVYFNSAKPGDFAERWEVYNTLGQKVRGFQKVSKIDISELPAGIYIVHVTSKNEDTITAKIVKK